MIIDTTRLRKETNLFARRSLALSSKLNSVGRNDENRKLTAYIVDLLDLVEEIDSFLSKTEEIKNE